MKVKGNPLSEFEKTVRPALSAPAELSTCERCGAAFGCGAQLAGCWCSEIKLGEAARSELSGRYAGCLCRACLESMAEVERGRVEKNDG